VLDNKIHSFSPPVQDLAGWPEFWPVVSVLCIHGSPRCAGGGDQVPRPLLSLPAGANRNHQDPTDTPLSNRYRVRTSFKIGFYIKMAGCFFKVKLRGLKPTWRNIWRKCLVHFIYLNWACSVFLTQSAALLQPSCRWACKKEEEERLSSWFMPFEAKFLQIFPLCGASLLHSSQLIKWHEALCDRKQVAAALSPRSSLS